MMSGRSCTVNCRRVGGGGRWDWVASWAGELIFQLWRRTDPRRVTTQRRRGSKVAGYGSSQIVVPRDK